MRRLAISAILLVLAATTVTGLACSSSTTAPSPTPEPSPTTKPAWATDYPVLDEIATVASQLRELSLPEEIDVFILSPAELEAALEESWAEVDLARQWMREEAVIRTLGLIEPDFDLSGRLMEHFTRSMRGLFDRESNFIILRKDSQEFGYRESIDFAHEYTHALQHHNFGFESLLLSMNMEGNSDMSLATSSLLEGDAMCITYRYAEEQHGILEADLQALLRDAETKLALDSDPPVVRSRLLFPYDAGTPFVRELFQSGGWEAVNRAYEDPPQSTEQIIHPERYIDRDEPQPVTLPDLQKRLRLGWHQVDTNVLGELYIRILLESSLDADVAASAASGWDGDRYVYLEDISNRPLLVLRSVWDSDQDAQEFFNAYADLTDAKYGEDASSIVQDPRNVLWDGQESDVYLSIMANTVTLVIAPDTTTIEVILPDLGLYIVRSG